MSDYIYLTDKNQCPHCRVNRNNQHSGNCHNCGTRLFVAPISNFEKFEDETGIRYWWAWSGTKHGWKHRDFYMVEDAKPLVKRYEVPNLPKNYGQQISPDEVVERKAKNKRIKRK